MNITKSNTYVLKWGLKDNPNYRFTQCGKCFNVKTGNEIKKVMVGRAIGFCVPNFKSVNSIRKMLVKIENITVAF